MADSTGKAKPVALNDDNYEEMIAKAGTPVVVEFWAPWCHHCRALSPVLESVAAEMAGKVLIGQVNCDLNDILPNKFNVQVLPTLFLVKNGEVVGTAINPKDKVALTSWINGLIG